MRKSTKLFLLFMGNQKTSVIRTQVSPSNISSYLFVYPEDISPSNWLIAFSSINILRGVYGDSVDYMWLLYVIALLVYSSLLY